MEGLQGKFCSGHVEAGEKSYMNKPGLPIWTLELHAWLSLSLSKTIMSSFFTVLSVQPAHLFSNSDTLSLISSAFPKQRHSLCGGFYGCESVCPSSPLFIPCFFLIVGRWETKTLSSSPPSFPSLFSPPATHLPVLAVFSFFR